MEKQLKSSLRSSAETFLSLATSRAFNKQLKAALKTTIYSTTPLPSTLSSALHSSISHSLQSPARQSPSRPHSLSPPPKRPRRTPRPSPSPPSPLRILAEILSLCSSHPSHPLDPSQLLPSLKLLHDGIVLYDAQMDLRSVVAGLCEDWWKRSLPGRELLISQSMPFLLSRSLEQGGRKADIRRVYAVREAFTMFDLEDESSEDLRLLLVRCVITPLYLKTDEGRRFITYALGLNARLLKEALALVRSQIPFGRRSVLEAYRDVLFSAWKSLEGSLKGEMEDGFLQALVEGAIYASSRELAMSIRRVLGGFVEHRATDGVNKLLFRLAEPILFRSLQVANSSVRLNALHMLIDLFPLEDPDVMREAKYTSLEKQLFLLEKLLVDDCPDVRAVDVEGICRILNMFWEVIPSSMITTLFAKIVDTMSHDSSPEVRISTVNGVIYLLENPQSHEVLKMLLPRLGHLFLDSALSVRKAFAEFLLTVRDIRAIPFNKVVNLIDLLSALADDQSVVAQKITRLLVPSYFPANLPVNEACHRCIALIKSFPLAGARLCEFAYVEEAPLEALLELVKTCVNSVLSSRDLSPCQVDGLFISSANLCCSLSNDTSCKVALSDFFCKDKLKSLLRAAKSTRSRTSFMRIVLLFSHAEITELREHCMELVMIQNGLIDSEEVQAEIRAAHKLMFACGWFDRLVGLLIEVLETASLKLQTTLSLKTSLIPKASSVRKKKVKLPKKVLTKLRRDNEKNSSISRMLGIEEGYALAAAASWQVRDLLMSADTRDAVLKLVSESTLYALSALSEMCITNCLSDISPVLAYMSLSMHMSLRITDSMAERQFTEEPVEETILSSSLKHLVKCIEKMFLERDATSSSKSSFERKLGKSVKHVSVNCSEDLSGTPISGDIHVSGLVEPSKTSNLLRLVTTVLKFLCDSASTGLISFDEPIWLQFSSAYLVHLKSVFREYKQFGEDNFLCIRSSFTYTAMMLHNFFSAAEESSSMLLVASDLANHILDLVALAESCLGPVYARRIVAVAQPWLPDLLLGLSSPHLHEIDEEGSHKVAGTNVPEWLVRFGKVEVCDVMSKLSLDLDCDDAPEPETSVLKKLVGMMVPLLQKGDMKILDAVALVFLLCSKGGLDSGDIDFALGLIHFICEKLLGAEFSELKDLQLTNNYLGELFSSIEIGISDNEVCDDQRQRKLECARDTLKLVMAYS